MTQLASSGGYKDQVLYVLSEEPSSSLSFEKPSSVLPQVVAERFETLRVSQESTPQSHIDKQRESEATKKVSSVAGRCFSFFRKGLTSTFSGAQELVCQGTASMMIAPSNILHWLSSGINEELKNREVAQCKEMMGERAENSKLVEFYSSMNQFLSPFIKELAEKKLGEHSPHISTFLNFYEIALARGFVNLIDSTHAHRDEIPRYDHQPQLVNILVFLSQQAGKEIDFQRLENGSEEERKQQFDSIASHLLSCLFPENFSELKDLFETGKVLNLFSHLATSQIHTSLKNKLSEVLQEAFANLSIPPILREALIPKLVGSGEKGGNPVRQLHEEIKKLKEMAPKIEREREENRQKLDQLSGSHFMSSFCKAIAKDVAELIPVKMDQAAPLIGHQFQSLGDIANYLEEEMRTVIEKNSDAIFFGSELLRTYLEGVLLKICIKVVEKNPPRGAPVVDSLIVITEKVLRLFEESFFNGEKNEIGDICARFIGDVLGIDSPYALEGVPTFLQVRLYALLQEQVTQLVLAAHEELSELRKMKKETATETVLSSGINGHLVQGFAAEIGNVAADALTYYLVHASDERTTGIDKITDMILEESSSALKTVRNLTDGNLRAAEVIREYVLGTSFKEAVAAQALNEADPILSRKIRAEIAVVTTQVVMGPVARVVERVAEFENEKKAFFTRRVVLDVLGAAKNHFEYLNQLKQGEAVRNSSLSTRQDSEQKAAFYVKTAGSLLKLGFPNQAADLTFLREGKRDAAWKKIEKELPELLPKWVEELVDDQMIQFLMLNGLEIVRDALQKPESEVEKLDDDRNLSNEDVILDNAIGSLLEEVLKGMEIPSFLKKNLFDAQGYIQPKIKSKLGGLLRAQLNDTFIQNAIEKAMEAVIPKEGEESSLLQQQVGKLLKREKSKESDIAMKMKRETNIELEKTSREVVDAALNLVVIQKRAEWKTKEAKFFSRVKNRILSRLIGGLLWSPCKKIVYRIVNKNRTRLLEILTQRPKLDVSNIGSRSSLHESLVINFVRAIDQAVLLQSDKAI